MDSARRDEKPQFRARKVVFIPVLIPQPDWDKYHFFLGLIPYFILRVAGFDSASGPIPVNIPHCARAGAFFEDLNAAS